MAAKVLVVLSELFSEATMSARGNEVNEKIMESRDWKLRSWRGPYMVIARQIIGHPQIPCRYVSKLRMTNFS